MASSQTTNSSVLVCEDCRQSFSSRPQASIHATMTGHMATRHCEKCHKLYDTTRALRQHEKSSHPHVKTGATSEASQGSRRSPSKTTNKTNGIGSFEVTAGCLSQDSHALAAREPTRSSATSHVFVELSTSANGNTADATGHHEAKTETNGKDLAMSYATLG
jgi:hypothetical protein